MAGDWMQIDLDLAEKPEVLLLKANTGMGTEAIVGRLVAFWRWIEKNGVDGFIAHANASVVGDVVNAEFKFVETLVQVKWLEFTENGAIIPGWEKRFCKAAKQRIADAKRQQSGRASKKSGQMSESSGQMSGSSASKLGTKEEGEKKKKKIIPPPPPPSSDKRSPVPDQDFNTGGEGVLLELGVREARAVMASLAAAGCDATDINGVIDFWRVNQPAWDCGALVKRLLVLRPRQDPAALWPTPSKESEIKKSRELSLEKQSALEQQKRLEAEKQKADLAHKLELEGRYGDYLDSLTAKEIRMMTTNVCGDSASFLLDRYKSGPPRGLHRESLLLELSNSKYVIPSGAIA